MTELLPRDRLSEVLVKLKLPKFFSYQEETFATWLQLLQTARPNMCVYHRTGAGKSITSMAAMYLADQTEVVVIAPPITHGEWVALGRKLGIKVTAISHAKFRMKDYKVSRNTALICDEFHMLGGINGKGWTKFDRMMPGMNAPVIICSATPNYNDAERVYCIQHALDPNSCRGGFLNFLYQHCRTKANPFSMTPDVDGFLRYPSAAAYLVSLPYVTYLEDDAEYEIEDIHIPQNLPPEYTVYGFNARNGRMLASQIEERHQTKYWALLNLDGSFRNSVLGLLTAIFHDRVELEDTKFLVYAESSSVAYAAYLALRAEGYEVLLLNGQDSTKNKEFKRVQFVDGPTQILVGTSSLATGMDGVDKVANTLVILDDTPDDSLRRQLVGRVLPRGAAKQKRGTWVYRMVW